MSDLLFLHTIILKKTFYNLPYLCLSQLYSRPTYARVYIIMPAMHISLFNNQTPSYVHTTAVTSLRQHFLRSIFRQCSGNQVQGYRFSQGQEFLLGTVMQIDRQNIVAYARKLAFSDEDRIIQKRVAVIMANYALTIAIFHQRHTHMCLKVLTLLIFLPERR